MSELLIADVNEFRPLKDGKAYASWSPVCITRVSYSNTHIDNQFGTAVAQMNLGNLASRGFYGYARAGVDPYSQGVFFAKALLGEIGSLLSSDFLSWDIEEGSGDLETFAGLWMSGCHAVIKDNPSQDWGYSGQNFWTAHLGNHNTEEGITHRWVASYGVSNPPPLGEDLWQFTDAQPVPGVQGTCDCSKFNGDVNQFLSLIGASTPEPVQPVQPTPKPPQPEPDHAHHNVFTPIAVDGSFGPATVKALQYVLYVAPDGNFGPISKRALQKHVGVAQDGQIGPVTVKALQRRLGVTQDGQWGSQTTRALQSHLNAGSF